MSEAINERRGRPSASSMHRVWACAGSQNLIESIPPDERVKVDDEVTASGNRVHAALAGDEEPLDMTEGEIKQRLAELEAEVVEQWKNGLIAPALNGAPMPPISVVREERQWITDQDTLEQLASAKPDVIYICGREFALVINYKAAFKAVTPAQRNHQCRTEALAVWSEFYPDHVRVAVVQHRLKSAVTQADYDADALYQAAEQLKFTLWRAAQPDAPRSAGSHCDWCDAKAHCPEAITYALVPMSAVAVASPQPSKVDVAFAVSMMPPEGLAYVERRRLISEKIFKAVRERLKALPPAELAVLGFELSEGRNQLQARDINGAFDTLVADGLLTEAEILSCVEWKNGAVEELAIPRIIAKTPGLNQSAAKNILRAKLAPFISYDDPANRTQPILKEAS